MTLRSKKFNTAVFIGGWIFVAFSIVIQWIYAANQINAILMIMYLVSMGIFMSICFSMYLKTCKICDRRDKLG